MSVLATDFKTLIVASLADADESLRPTLEAKINFYWRLHNRAPYPELHYWLTRRDMIRVAQGCVRRQIDYLRRNQNSSRQMTSSSRQDSSMTASSEDNASSVANRSSESEYNDEINSAGTASGAASRNSSQSSSSTSDYADTGAGASLQTRVMHSENQVEERGDVQTIEDEDMGLTHNRTTQGARSGGTDLITTPADYGIEASAFFDSIHIVIAIPDIPAFASPFGDFGPFVIPDIEFDVPIPFAIKKETRTITAMQSNEDGEEDVGGALGGDMISERISDINVISLPTTDSFAATNDVQHSENEFTANVVQVGNGSASSSMAASSSSSSNESMTGAGAGTSSMTGASTSTMLGTAARVYHADGESHRYNQGVTGTDSIMEKLHQRFLHLQELWAMANETIKLLESQRLSLTHYQITAITINYPEGVDAVAANALLVKLPTQAF